MTPAITIAVVDDHPLFREGVIRSLSETGHFEVVAVGSTSSEAIDIAARTRPDVLLIDLSMPGGGHNAIEPILSRNPSQCIVVLTVSEMSEDVAAALNAGAKGYVLKGVGSRSLAEILSAVASGETYVTPSLSAQLLSTLSDAARSGGDSVGALSEREREVLTLVASGLSNKKVALRLDLTEKTVKHHMSRIFSKLQASNRTEAAMIFRNSVDTDASTSRTSARSGTADNPFVSRSGL
ncbi:LuxR C-terminal-related transcriptional regulator [Mesorhizobium sp. IMUNJ 23232]|uniref:LuxR C-terminal-related transcriptional regulator n=1 Tax=Mesorhizobium sp. IMUNJ 23232 TaxID=3376064 RepID=UPI00378DA8B0